MRTKLSYYTLSLLLLLFISCKSHNNTVIETEVKTEVPSTAINQIRADSIQVQESHHVEDLPINDHLIEKLKPIRANFKRINSVSNWTSINTKELLETTEGGEARYYYLNGQLEKIITHEMGETFQLLTEYYFMNGNLSFVLEKAYKYNRPINYDSTDMKENNDTEVFDFDKSQLIENRSYFENGKLLHQINNPDNGSALSNDYLIEEQKRIKGAFEKLIQNK